VDLRLRVGGGLVRSRRRETVDEDGEVVVLAVLVRRSGFEHVVTSGATARDGGHARIASGDRMLHRWVVDGSSQRSRSARTAVHGGVRPLDQGEQTPGRSLQR
jgi:hypothetical protein